MNKKNIFFIFLLLFIDCKAQIINNKPVDIYAGPINFNPDVIKQNKIKSIVMDIVDKPDGAVIIDKNAAQGYEFDNNGRLTRYYYTILNKTETHEVNVPEIKRHGRVIRPATTDDVTKYINDTIFVNIFYDDHNRIIAKRMRTEDYYDAFYYEYNDQGQIKKEMHCKETNVSENKNEFKLGVQKILSTETFVYTMLTPTQLKKQCLNDEGREYKKAIINYDDKGSQLSENYEFIVTWMREENTYIYNADKQLLEYTFTNNESGELKKRSVFEYNKNGMLLTEKKFKNNVLTDEINYLYDETNTFIKSEVNRDYINASIGIVKCDYTFY
jgi:hypothetical protein